MLPFREPVNGFTHLAGALLAALGLVWLLTVTQGDAVRMLVVGIYGLSMIALYSASALFHLAQGSERTLLWLRRVDHAAIYFMIAGTYTPICYVVLEGAWRWLLLGLVWGCALLGAGYKLLFLQRGGPVSLLTYVGMGWLGIIALPQALGLLPAPAIALIIGGGVLYMIGAAIFSLQKPNFHRHFGHHELWHLLVLGGSALHFAAIRGYIIGS